MIARHPGSSPRRGRARTRPTPTVRRASARRRFSPRRALAALALVASGLAIYGLAASPAFAVRSVTTTGAGLTGEAEILAALALPTPVAGPDGEQGGVSVVTLATAPLAARVAALPTVASVVVTAALPDAVQVAVTEREPAASGDLPSIVDERKGSAALVPGAMIDRVDLDVATRLASLTAADIGSSAETIAVSVTDPTGWSLSVPDGWEAVFGFYPGSIRPPDIIPEQVRLLRSLLAVREDRLKRAILASGETGTYSLR
ncbi:MAG: FtsQ-type POTRA domain-containing protein [Chloroflexi bacterium]|nr:FtsQ-type POTRA domain-containing protein [Chloroflexota bacterium]